MELKKKANGDYLVRDDGASFYITKTAAGFLVKNDVLGSSVLHSGVSEEDRIIENILKDTNDGFSLA